MAKRIPGWYWVKIKNGRWVISEWDGVQWAWKGCSYLDNAWEKINERSIIKDET